MGHGDRNTARRNVPWLFGYLSVVSVCIYFATTDYATILFLKNIMALAKLGNESMKSGAGTRKLNKMQTTLIRKAAKYVSLLSLAASFNSIGAIAWALIEYAWDDELDHNDDRMNVVLKQLFAFISTVCCVINMLS